MTSGRKSRIPQTPTPHSASSPRGANPDSLTADHFPPSSSDATEQPSPSSSSSSLHLLSLYANASSADLQSLEGLSSAGASLSSLVASLGGVDLSEGDGTLPETALTGGTRSATGARKAPSGGAPGKSAVEREFLEEMHQQLVTTLYNPLEAAPPSTHPCIAFPTTGIHPQRGQREKMGGGGIEWS